MTHLLDIFFVQFIFFLTNFNDNKNQFLIYSFTYMRYGCGSLKCSVVRIINIIFWRKLSVIINKFNFMDFISFCFILF